MTDSVDTRDPVPATGASQHEDVTSREGVLQFVLRLARTVNVEMDEREIVSHYIEALSTLFPRFRFAVRLTVPDSRSISLFQTSVDAHAPPTTEIQLSRDALRRHSLSENDVVAPGIRIVDRDDPDHFDVPLLDARRLGGVLTVDCQGTPPNADARATIVELALSLEGLLRSSRLLRESRYLRDYLSRLIDNANAPIMVIGRHRTVKVVNRALLMLTGLARESLLGQDFLQILAEDDRAQVIPVMVNALRGEPVSNVEIRIQRRDGGHARLSISTSSLMGPDGEVDGVIAIGRDLTEVRHLEEQVIQAEKLATLGQLAAGVVHELNNPLTSISVYSDYLHKKLEGAGHDAADVERLRRIHQNTERILRFTRDLVTYARPSTGVPAYESIHEVLDQALVFCEHVIGEAGAAIERRFTTAPSEVYAVKAQLHQVFINLITNACHAMPEGAGQLVLETRVVRGKVYVRISDNGPGIAPGQRDRIFEPFYSTKGEGKGTGLGLSIVRNIVDQHGGEIRVEADVGQGATFEIILPVRASETNSRPSN
ncbi:MAG: ATP-binding protein [Polyangiales bacterium]